VCNHPISSRAQTFGDLVSLSASRDISLSIGLTDQTVQGVQPPNQ
jgi:hypothetical protein